MTRMVILGGLGVSVRMEGVLVMVGDREGVKVWVSVGVLVTGRSTTRVTSEVSTRVTSLVT